MSDTPVVREATPADADAISALTARSADGGAVAFRVVEHVAAVDAAVPGTRRVVAVAELPRAGIVGAAAVTCGRFLYDRAERPFALLSSLAVDPQHRRRGVGTALASWRLSFAERELGERAVILADIQRGNTASLAVAGHWATGFGASMLSCPRPMLTRPPRLPAGISVRDATPDDYPGICDQLARRAADRDLARIWTPATLGDWLAASPLPERIARYRVATDAEGRVIGGLAVRDEGRLRSMEIVHMAAPIRAANLLLRVVPRDGVLRNVTVEHLWHVPGRLDAAAALYQHARWADRDCGNTLLITIDARDPIRRALRIRPWTPTTSTVAAIRVDVLSSPERLVEPLV